jgi:hypothetical protein
MINDLEGDLKAGAVDLLLRPDTLQTSGKSQFYV